jgi:hypothetical protein
MVAQKVSAVPETTKQGTEALSPRWGWAEASIWTARMVSALVNGVKGGKWYSLVDSCQADHQRWPNPFFAAHGLFTLHTAYLQARHSRCGNQRLESRMRENRTYGSEGGEGHTLPDPYRGL